MSVQSFIKALPKRDRGPVQCPRRSRAYRQRICHCRCCELQCKAVRAILMQQIDCLLTLHSRSPTALVLEQCMRNVYRQKGQSLTLRMKSVQFLKPVISVKSVYPLQWCCVTCHPFKQEVRSLRSLTVSFVISGCGE